MLKNILGFDNVAYIARKLFLGTDQNAVVPRIAFPIAKINVNIFIFL